MQDQVNEKISLLIDDELYSESALSLLQTMRNETELKKRLQRYQLISQVLKNETCYFLDENFAEKIHQQISYEPSYLIPRKKPVINWQKAGLAVAASVMLSVVLFTQKMDKSPYSHALQAPVALNIQQPVTAGTMNAHFNDYLQAHDNAVYSNQMPRVQPYARVVGYQQQ